MNELTVTESKRLLQLETVIQRTKQPFMEFGRALCEIRDSRLYRHQYKTFEQYCQGRWKFGRHYVNQVIKSSKAVLQLKDLGSMDTKLSKSVTPEIVTERQGRALAEVPADKRLEVLQEAEKHGTITSTSIKKAAAKLKVADVMVKDREGCPIPGAAMPIWNRRDELKEELKTLQDLKIWATDMQGTQDTLFVEVNFTALKIDLETVIRNLKKSVPYAVCPVCQAHAADQCTVCNGRGMISEFYAKSPAVTEEVKRMRQKMVQSA